MKSVRRHDGFALMRAASALHFDGLCVGAQNHRIARAERELARLHCFETARLLREAATLCCERLEARTVPAPSRLVELRTALAEEFRAQRADDVRATLHLRALIEVCASHAPERWSPVELARTALALQDNRASQACFERALRCESTRRAAVRDDDRAASL
jgi:hypothetical protein